MTDKEKKRGLIEASEPRTLDPVTEIFIEASRRLEGILENNGVLPAATSASGEGGKGLPATPSPSTDPKNITH